MASHPQPHFVVASHKEGFIKKTDLVHTRFPKNHRARPKKCFCKEFWKDVTARGRHPEPLLYTLVNNAGFVEKLHVRIHQSDFRMFFEIIHLEFQFVRKPQVVRVEKSDKVASGLSDTGISGGWLSSILLMNVNDPIPIFL